MTEALSSPAAHAWLDLPADQRRRRRLARDLAGRGLSEAVLAAFMATPRQFFLPPFVRAQAYDDSPIAIGCGQTISQPSLVLRMLDVLQVEPGMHVLDVGSGSGYVTALLAHVLGPQGMVQGVEFQSALLTGSRAVLSHFAAAKDRALLQLHAAGPQPGCPQHGPYERIHVGCAAAGEVPPALIAQLAKGGRMVIPVEHGDGRQYLILVSKDPDGQLQRQQLDEVLFVPLR